MGANRYGEKFAKAKAGLVRKQYMPLILQAPCMYIFIVFFFPSVVLLDAETHPRVKGIRIPSSDGCC